MRWSLVGVRVSGILWDEGSLTDGRDARGVQSSTRVNGGKDGEETACVGAREPLREEVFDCEGGEVRDGFDAEGAEARFVALESHRHQDRERGASEAVRSLRGAQSAPGRVRGRKRRERDGVQNDTLRPRGRRQGGRGRWGRRCGDGWWCAEKAGIQSRRGRSRRQVRRRRGGGGRMALSGGRAHVGGRGWRRW